MGVDAVALLQDIPHLVGGDGVHPAAEGDQLHQIHVRLGGDVPGGGVKAAVVGPLVQHPHREPLHVAAHRVLGDHRRPQAGDELIDAVVHFRVAVVGASRQDDDRLFLLPGLADNRLPLAPDGGQVVLVLLVGGVGSPLDFPQGDALPVLGQYLRHLPGEVPPLVQPHVVGDEGDAAGLRHIGADDLRVVGHHRAVIMVIPQLLIQVVGHTGVKDGLYLLGNEGLHMAVHQLGGEADGVRRDGVLPGKVQLPAAEGAGDHLKAQLGEEGVPEGQQLKDIKAHGQPQLSPGSGHRAVALELLQLPLAKVQGIVRLPVGDGPLAPVAADVPSAAAEGVHRQAAVVGAEAAAHPLGLVVEVLYLPRAQDAAAAWLPPGKGVPLDGVKGGAVGPHQPGDVGAHHLHPQLLLEGPEDGVVVEGAPLDHNVPPQLPGVGGPDDLIEGVFHHADRKPGGDILHAGPVLLGLLDAGVHKDGAAAPQIHRAFGEEPQVGKVLDGIAQGLGKGLQKAAAAGGAGFV